MAYLLFKRGAEAPEFVGATHWKSCPGAYLLSLISRNWYFADQFQWTDVPTKNVPAEIRTVALLLL